MSSFLRTVLGLALLSGGLQTAGAFALRGTSEDYTGEASLGHEGSIGFGFTPAFLNWVKNLDDEYRYNTRIVYYSYDPEFTSYFGSNGIVAIDQAFAVLNGLTNASSYSSNLTEYPLDAKRINYTAAALDLLDLKSVTLELMLTELGLGDAESFTWTLRNRWLPPGAQCPQYVYNVIMRNFDPVTLSPTPYVNGNLFTYQIIELCPTPSEADAVEVRVDPLAVFGSAVSSLSGFTGDYWTGLTRDDVGGFRYMLRTNNVNWETSPANAFIFSTNQVPTLLFPSNLQVFVEQSLTNDAGALQALYPGLVVTGTSNYFVNEVITNAFAFFTNYPWQPVGTPPVLLQGTNFTTNVATRFVHTFENIQTNTLYPFCLQSVLITNIAPAPLSPPGSGVSQTNVTMQTSIDTNCVSGSFFILPTNVCQYSILYTQLTQVTYATNLLTNTFTTNVIVYSNATTTNASFDYFEFSVSDLEVFTNNILVGYQVLCPEEITTLFQGIEKVNFVRRDYDSLFGQFFEPATNDFSMVEITNNTRVIRHGRRTVVTPDFLFSADDITAPPTAIPSHFIAGITTPNYVTASNLNVLGPGTIEPSTVITVNKVGPLFQNVGPLFITEASATRSWRWGSYDGSTNAPIAYPVGTDLLALENMAVLQVTQPNVVTNGALALPDGTNNVAYSFQLQALGGQTPYTWSAVPGLPPGLMFSPPGSGFITGTPTLAGVYVFTVRLTELGSRHVDVPMTLTINP